MVAAKTEQLPATIHMRLFDPEHDRLRLYSMREQMTLFGTPELLIEWGRLGHRLRLRIERFPCSEMLEKRKAELLARRHRHGYVSMLPAAWRQSFSWQLAPKHSIAVQPP